jgi:hypothetical protein
MNCLINRSIHPLIHPSINPSIHPSTIHQSINQSINQPTWESRQSRQNESSKGPDVVVGFLVLGDLHDGLKTLVVQQLTARLL